jgi:O-antigen/teichoic acid export membrane protein
LGNTSPFISGFKRISSFKGGKRSVQAKKNILAAFIIKGLGICTGLVLLPLTINYLTPEKYGIWITLSSIIGWFSFFDIGLGNGLRNHFAQAIAENKKTLAKTYVSTTYAILIIIVSIVLTSFLIVNHFLNWNNILNVKTGQFKVGELSLLAIIVFSFFCLRFVFLLINTILNADQQSAKASVLDLLGQILSLIIIFILTKETKGSILYLGITISSMPVFVLIIANIWFYNKKYKEYRPSIKFVDFSKGRSLLNLGVSFFVIQIAGVLLYQTNNMIIIHLSGSEDVTNYNIAYKYFSVLLMGFSIIITPFWSAFTEAWVMKDMDWIRRVIKKLFKIWFLFFITALIMLLFSERIYKLWIGSRIHIPFVYSILVGIVILINIWNGIFSQFLNGIGKIRFQLIIGISAAIINVPLAIFLGSSMGVKGVLMANIIVTLFGVFLYPLQYKKILNNTAKGIWNK